MRAVRSRNSRSTPEVADVPRTRLPRARRADRGAGDRVCAAATGTRGKDTTPPSPCRTFRVTSSSGSSRRSAQMSASWVGGERVTAPFVNACGELRDLPGGPAEHLPEPNPARASIGTVVRRARRRPPRGHQPGRPPAADRRCHRRGAGLAGSSTAYRAVTSPRPRVTEANSSSSSDAAASVSPRSSSRSRAAPASWRSMCRPRRRAWPARSAQPRSSTLRSDDVDTAIRRRHRGRRSRGHRGPRPRGLLRQGLACLRPADVTCRSACWPAPMRTRTWTSVRIIGLELELLAAATACPRTSTPRCSTRSHEACSTRARWSDGRSRWMPRPQRSQR